MNNVKFLVAMLFVALLMAGMVPSAGAITITPSTGLQWSGVDPGNPDASDVADIVGYTGSEALLLLYKQDVPKEPEEGEPPTPMPAELGSWAPWYETTFSNSEYDPEDALIHWVGNAGDPFIAGDPLYLLVKDGNHDPIWYVFDLLHLNPVDTEGNGTFEKFESWNGTDDIVLDGFWPDKGAISHVSIFGTTPAPVSEPASLLLLGAGLIVFAGLGRRRFKK